jgi:glycosyltransferase involved in cell wall biosynthesis
MKKINIIHLISSFGRGGRERQLATIYKHTDKTRISTTIICINKARITYIDEYDMSDDILFISSVNPIDRFIEIRRIVKTLNADLIWSWGTIEASLSILISLTTRIKHINGSIRHGVVNFNKHQIGRLLILHLSKNIVANSDAGLRANKLNRGLVLYNGIDNDFFIEPTNDPLLILNEFGISRDIVLLSSVANLVPYKDYFSILKALSIIKAKGILFNYIAIGEGSERKKIEDLVLSLDLSKEVFFPGRRVDIKNMLHASDIFIHSSFGEGCSNAILEAMAAGLPVIASDTGGTREVVDNRIGRLFDYQNVQQLANALSLLIENKSLRKEMAENAKNKAINDFSTEKMMTNYYNIIEAII